MEVSFNKPFITGNEIKAIEDAIARSQLSGDGHYTKACERWLSDLYGSPTVLTHSGTAALEMMALLLDIGPGDEVIMPSFTFVSTANAIVLRGATPVFVDIDEDTLNIDPEAIAAAITPRTKAIMVVHYAGVGCAMDRIESIARRHGIALLEDAAHCLQARYNGRELGSIGALGALSFHETKNIIAGEGGALIINDPTLVDRAEIIRQKGTNRKQFFEKKVDKYSWVDLGSSFLPSDITAAFLYPQLEAASEITAKRRAAWRGYHERLAPLEAAGRLRRPIVSNACEHNGHIYYILLPPGRPRAPILEYLKARGVHAIFHFVPLHSAPAAARFARTAGSLARTDDLASRLVRLPLWCGIEEEMLDYVVQQLESVLA